MSDRLGLARPGSHCVGRGGWTRALRKGRAGRAPPLQEEAARRLGRGHQTRAPGCAGPGLAGRGLGWPRCRGPGLAWRGAGCAGSAWAPLRGVVAAAPGAAGDSTSTERTRRVSRVPSPRADSAERGPHDVRGADRGPQGPNCIPYAPRAARRLAHCHGFRSVQPPRVRGGAAATAPTATGQSAALARPHPRRWRVAPTPASPGGGRRAVRAAPADSNHLRVTARGPRPSPCSVFAGCAV